MDTAVPRPRNTLKYVRTKTARDRGAYTASRSLGKPESDTALEMESFLKFVYF